MSDVLEDRTEIKPETAPVVLSGRIDSPEVIATATEIAARQITEIRDLFRTAGRSLTMADLDRFPAESLAMARNDAAVMRDNIKRQIDEDQQAGLPRPEDWRRRAHAAMRIYAGACVLLQVTLERREWEVINGVSPAQRDAIRRQERDVADAISTELALRLEVRTLTAKLEAAHNVISSHEKGRLEKVESYKAKQERALKMIDDLTTKLAERDATIAELEAKVEKLSKARPVLTMNYAR